jgi:hypothetical protein
MYLLSEMDQCQNFYSGGVQNLKNSESVYSTDTEVCI